MWKQPIGGGYASFVIAGGRAFTIEQRGPKEVVAAYDVKSGRELWTNAWDAAFTESMGGDGPRATPTWSDGRLYALGATGELRALDEGTGRVVWRTNMLADSGAGNLPSCPAGPPASPLSRTTAGPANSSGRRWAMHRRTRHRCSSRSPAFHNS
jgi:outer membrane protein assembly factor BamB